MRGGTPVAQQMSSPRFTAECWVCLSKVRVYSASGFRTEIQRREINTKQIKRTTDGQQREKKKYGRKIRTKKERKERKKK